MPLVVTILPDLALIRAVYTGVAGLAETIEATATCAAHPDFRTSFRHLVDLRGVTDFERDKVGYFVMQARVIEHFPVMGEGLEPLLMVLIAPPGPPRQMAEQIRRSWDGLGAAIVRIVEDAEAARSILGLPEAIEAQAPTLPDAIAAGAASVPDQNPRVTDKPANVLRKS